MMNDFTMITHRFPNEITLIPIADVHFGALEHDTKAWEDFCAKIVNEPNTYLCLVGDLVNNNTRSSVGNPFDEVVRPREQKRIMTEFLTPLKGKILAAVSGNHERRTSAKESDQDITYDIMARLGIEDLYRENVAFVKVSLGTRERDKSPEVSYTFVITHGAGGGIYTGAAVNRNERWGNIIEGCDCIVVGHTHKGTVSRPTKIVIDRKNDLVTMPSYLVVSAESWMTYGGYAAQKMLLPSESSHPQRLLLKRDRNNKRIEVTW